MTYLELKSNVLPVEYDDRHQVGMLSGNAIASYSGSPRSNLGQDTEISGLRIFYDFLKSFQSSASYYIDRFLPDRFQFISHETLCCVVLTAL